MMSSRILAWISLAWVVLAIPLVVSPISFAGETEMSANSSSTVYVAVERAVLRSGPGKEYYPTGHVAQGTSLEVFHRTDDAWLGIRPPQGSFSWVPASDAYLLPGGRVIEIINPKAVSWIGSSLGSAKQYRWQVQLKTAEQLSVLGEQATKDAEGQEVLWYKIAPPSGEFRWIRAEDVSSQPTPAAKSHQATANAKSNAKSNIASDIRSNSNSDSNRTSEAGQRQTATRAQPDQVSQARDNQVVTAAYQAPPGAVAEEVIVLGQSDATNVDGPMEGEVIDGGMVVGPYSEGETVEGEYEYVEGEYYEGEHEYVDGEYIEGEYLVDEYGSEAYFDDGSNYVQPHIPSRSNDPFNGWSALSFEDDGVRFTFLERIFGRAAQTGPDPLADDPFALAMNRGTVRANSPRAVLQMGPPPAASTYVESHAPGTRLRKGGWRDPRTLGQNHGTNSLNTPTTAPIVSNYGITPGDDQQLAHSSGPLSGFDRASNSIESVRAKLVARLSPAQRDELQASSTLNSLASNALGPSQDNSSGQSSSAANGIQWFGIASRPPAAFAPAGQASGQLGVAAANLTRNSQSLDLSQLQLALSEAVTQPMQFWSLQQIYDSTRYYVEHGASPVERGQARLLLERIEEFADLARKSGYIALNGSASGSMLSPASSVTSASGIATTSPVVNSDFQQHNQQGNFDATGWLVQVIAAQPGQPTHAISDQAGNVFAYVTPVPGLNLDRYINQPVGITGLRGYLPQLQAAHIQAQNVTRMH